MSDESYVERIAKSLIDNMAKLPEDFEVHSQYLKEYNKEAFINSFKSYYEFVTRLYEALNEYPEDFDLPVIKVSEELIKGVDFQKTYKAVNRIISFLYCLGYSGDLKEDKQGTYLLVNGKRLSELLLFTKTTNPETVFHAFENVGFIYEDLDFDVKNFKIRAVKDFKVRQKEFPNMFVGFKALIEANQNITNNLRSIKESFIRVDYRVIIKYTKKEPLLTIEEAVQSLNGHDQMIVKELDTLMTRLDYKSHIKIENIARGEWSIIYNHSKLKKSVLSFKIEENSLEIKLNLPHLPNYSDFVNKCPEYVKQPIRDSVDCIDCNPMNCKGGFTFKIDGVSYNKCSSLSFYYKKPLMEGLKYYRRLIELQDKELHEELEKVG